MRHHVGALITAAVLASVGALSEVPAGSKGTQGGRGTATPRREDNRPPVFFRED